MASIQAVMSGTWLDGLGDEASANVSCVVDSTHTLDDIITDQKALLHAMDDCSDGYLVKSRIIIEPDLPVTSKTGPTADSRMEIRPLFSMSNADNVKVFGVTVPAIAAAIISAGRIILTSGSAADVLIKILDGVTASLATVFTNPQFQDFAGLKSARIVTRKARRQTTRTSFEE